MRNLNRSTNSNKNHYYSKIGTDKILILDNKEQLCEVARPYRKSLFTILKHHLNLKCLIFTVLICFSLLATVFWSQSQQASFTVYADLSSFPITRREVDGYFYAYIPFAFVLLLYLLYLVECFHCRTRCQLSYKKTDVNSVYRMIDQMRRYSKPEIQFKVQCYHYNFNRRTRENTRYRNTYASSEVVHERINTRIASGKFCHTFCGVMDISKDLVDLEKYPMTKIKFSKNFLFANKESAADFDFQRARFLQFQQQFDDKLEIKEGLDLNVHFKDFVIAWANPDFPPWYAQIGVFWILSAFLLSWPLRILIEMKTAHLQYNITKLFGVNYGSEAYHLNFGTQRLQRNFRLFPQAHERVRRQEEPMNDTSTEDTSENSISGNSLKDEIKPILSKKKRMTQGQNFVISDEINNESNLRAKIFFGGTNTLKRSVTLVLRPRDHQFGYSTSAPADDNFYYLKDDDSFSLIPTYSEALLLCNDEKIENNNFSLLYQEQKPKCVITSVSSSSTAANLYQSGSSSNSTSAAGQCNNNASEATVSINLDANSCLQNSIDEPPSYKEALRFSRPLFYPALAKLRRCLTQKDVRGNGNSNSSPLSINRIERKYQRGSGERNEEEEDEREKESGNFHSRFIPPIDSFGPENFSSQMPSTSSSSSLPPHTFQALPASRNNQNSAMANSTRSEEEEEEEEEEDRMRKGDCV